MGRHLQLTLKLGLVFVVVLAGLAGCSETSEPPVPPGTSRSTGAIQDTGSSTVPTQNVGIDEPTTTSTTTVAPATVGLDPITRHYDVSLTPFSLAEDWQVALSLGYGSDESLLGNGDSVNEPWGPELPVALDLLGRWWILDNYKDRIARYGRDGSFFDSVDIAHEAPLSGLQILSDGTAIASSTNMRLATIIGNRITYQESDRLLSLINNDGDVVFGRETLGSRFFAVAIEDGALVAEAVDYLRTPAGSRYRLAADPSNPAVVRMSLPDAQPAMLVDLEMTSIDGGDVFAVVEVIADRQGSLHLLLAGFSEINEEVGIGAYVEIDRSGNLVRALPIPDPFGGRNPGTPNSLGLDPVSGDPYIGVIDHDGVTVWELNRASASHG